MTTNPAATVLPALKGYVIVDCYLSPEIDLEFIHPTIQAARDYIAEWYFPRSLGDLVICELDAPLREVERIKGAETLREEAEERGDQPLFTDQ